MQNLPSYLPSVDNLSYNVKDVINTLVVPVYGHREEESDDEEELYPKLYDSGESEDEEEEASHFGNTKKSKNPKSKTANQINTPKPAAIFQFVNKLSGKPINDLDVAKVQAISPLLGLAIDNVAEMHSVVNVRVGVAQNISKLINIANNGVTVNWFDGKEEEKEVNEMQKTVNCKCELI